MGSPAKCSPPTEPIRLKKDAIYFLFTAQNLVRHPKSPLKPLFRTVLLTDPLVDLRNEVEDFTIKSMYPGFTIKFRLMDGTNCQGGRCKMPASPQTHAQKARWIYRDVFMALICSKLNRRPSKHSVFGPTPHARWLSIVDRIKVNEVLPPICYKKDSSIPALPKYIICTGYRYHTTDNTNRNRYHYCYYHYRHYNHYLLTKTSGEELGLAATVRVSGNPTRM
ncbi:hypothetical protein MGG_18037 [Pyricularia oryzae 70-15]|uniref:Uncharacterized protein n=1 Tax=Pyricularia oryzae (strain 70-15 / ATCC MYA-4617 / FGSC 8958) TaxID=242507 RepID=G4NK53_PYRO7|nr:uncharacterized protein MGG_18037 [Pyricularia oryzae 70-15]EHA46538.1 hypothetical protein MGG_18037 [Pyricularia oryzae 70-15]